MKQGFLKFVFLWLLAYPLLLLIVLVGLGFFGIMAAMVGAVLLYYNPSVRGWLVNQRGYVHRLFRWPGLGDLSSAKAALSLLIYLLPLGSLGCLLIAVSLLLDVSDPGTLIVMLILGCGGLFWLYGQYIYGWGTPPASEASLGPGPTRHLKRVRRLDQMKALDPVAFETFTGSLFERMGYTVRTTAVSGDEGIDLLLHRADRRAVVQCKRYAGTVGQPVVRDLYGAMLHNRVDEAYLVTTGAISLPAQQWAAGKPIHLVDGSLLVEWVESLDRAEIAAGMLVSGPRQERFEPIALVDFFRQNLMVTAVVMMSLITPMFCCVTGLSIARLLEVWQLPLPNQETLSSILPSSIQSTTTATPDFGPAPPLILPQTIRSDTGWIFSLNRIDFLDKVESPAKRHRPTEGVFLILIGTLGNFTDEDACLRGWDLGLYDQGSQYRIPREVAEAVGSIYELDYPGFVLGQCLDYDSEANTIFLFDVPKDGADFWLEIKEARLRIGPIVPLIEATPIPAVEPP